MGVLQILWMNKWGHQYFKKFLLADIKKKGVYRFKVKCPLNDRPSSRETVNQ